MRKLPTLLAIPHSDVIRHVVALNIPASPPPLFHHNAPSSAQFSRLPTDSSQCSPYQLLLNFSAYKPPRHTHTHTRQSPRCMHVFAPLMQPRFPCPSYTRKRRLDPVHSPHSPLTRQQNAEQNTIQPAMMSNFARSALRARSFIASRGPNQVRTNIAHPQRGPIQDDPNKNREYGFEVLRRPTSTAGGRRPGEGVQPQVASTRVSLLGAALPSYSGQ